jgi:hypothetical protein
MWYHSYVTVSVLERPLSLFLCQDCSSSLSSSKIPKFSLRNNLYHVQLPNNLKGISWIDEKVCASHCVSTDVAHLHNLDHANTLPYRLVRSVCAHQPMSAPLRTYSLVFLLT